MIHIDKNNDIEYICTIKIGYIYTYICMGDATIQINKIMIEFRVNEMKWVANLKEEGANGVPI